MPPKPPQRPETADAPEDSELPVNWTSHVRHTGGGIWCREFHNQSKGLEVIYDVKHTEEGIGIQKGSFDENGYFEWSENVDKVGSPDSESEALEKAIEVVETIEEKGIEHYE